MPLWQEDYAGRKATGKKQTQEEHSALQLFAGKEGIRFPCDAPWLHREENSSLYPRGWGRRHGSLPQHSLPNSPRRPRLSPTDFPPTIYCLRKPNLFPFASSLLQNLRPVVKMVCQC